MTFFEYAASVIELNNWIVSYEAGNPVVSDSVYDAAYVKLKQFEALNQPLISPDSPTQRAGIVAVDANRKVDHKYKMISITNSNSREDVTTWVNSKIALGCKQFVLEYKIDGCALSTPFSAGHIIDGITRGNGSVGVSEFVNVMQIPAIVKEIDGFNGEVRGEVVWLVDDFNAYNDYLDSIGKEPISNPRNGAAGTLKLKDPDEVSRRKLSFVAYSVVDGLNNRYHSEDLEFLKKSGYIVSDSFVVNSLDKVLAGIDYMAAERHKLPYLTDGLVIKVNDKTAYNRLGGTSKSPHYLTAFKFPPEIKSTKLLSIENSVGKSGANTPVANVESVYLALTNVRRSSLHNWDMAEYLGMYNGCSVSIRKAGEIIPQIISVDGIDGNTRDDYEMLLDREGRDGILKAIDELHERYPSFDFIKRPTHCPHCDTQLVQKSNRSGDELTALVCPNQDCVVKTFKNILNFVSKKSMNIMGIGESLVESLLDKSLLADITDIYKITKADLLSLDSIKEQSADNAIASIVTSRMASMQQLLPGLGISNLGTTASNILSEHYGNLDAFYHATKNEMLVIDKIGPELVESIFEYFAKSGHIIEWFLSENIGCRAKLVAKTSSKLNDCVFIMTGKSDLIQRTQFKSLVVQNGGRVSTGISKKVDYVVLGEGAGPAKVKQINALKAEGSTIKTITDEEFMVMINR